MNNKNTDLLPLIMCLLLFLLGGLFCKAQESRRISLSFGEKGKEYHCVAGGVWNTPAAPEGAFAKGWTVGYASWTACADADFAGKHLENAHVNPHIHLTASWETRGGFRTEARLYPIAGVAGLSSKDSRFDYGFTLNLTMGWKAGIGGVIRVTRHTRAAGLCIAF